MEICGVGYRSREYSLEVLALGLAEELLPPLCEEGQLRVVGHQYLSAQTVAVEQVAHCGILEGRVALYAAFCAKFLHFLRTLEQSPYVKAAQYDRKQSHRGHYGEASSYAVFDHEGPVALLGGEALEGTPLCVGHGNYACGCLFLAVAVLEILLYDTECYCRLCGGA